MIPLVAARKTPLRTVRSDRAALHFHLTPHRRTPPTNELRTWQRFSLRRFVNAPRFPAAPANAAAPGTLPGTKDSRFRAARRHAPFALSTQRARRIQLRSMTWILSRDFATTIFASLQIPAASISAPPTATASLREKTSSAQAPAIF